MPYEPILIQSVLMPAYYKDFQCLMGACKDDCCDYDWNIKFSKKDYLKIKRATKGKAVEELLSKGVKRLKKQGDDAVYAEFSLSEEGKCLFHDENGLCRIQAECGAEALPVVCRQFPRFDKYTAAYRERSLSPACEGVLELLWNLTEGIDFIEEPLEREECLLCRPHTAVQARFMDIRSLCIDVLQERTLCLSQRLLLLGILLQRLRDMSWTDERAVASWLVQSEALIHDAEITGQLDQLPRNREVCLKQNNELFHYMGEDFGRELVESMIGYTGERRINWVYGFHPPHYQRLENQLEELLGGSEYFWENLMVTVAFIKGLPMLDSPEALWKSYVLLCSRYSLFRSAAICGCGKEASKERLFHILVCISRRMLHSKELADRMWEYCLEHENASLAYMAILVGG